MGQLYWKSEKPVTLARLVELWRPFAELQETAARETGTEQNAMLPPVDVDLKGELSEREWEAEQAAWQELVRSGAHRMRWFLSPLVVPSRWPSHLYGLLAGWTIGEMRETDDKLSPLALVWLRQADARCKYPTDARVRDVRTGDGQALLQLEEANGLPRGKEMMAHEQEHVDEGMMLIQVNLDDLSAEWVSYTMEKLFAAGANDVTLIPMTMKKSRQGSMLQVLCYQSQLEIMKTILFTETTTFGVRYFPLSCHRLGRRFVKVKTTWGEVSVKLGYHQGKRVQESPEYEECARLAREAGVPLAAVYTEARSLAKQLPD